MMHFLVLYLVLLKATLSSFSGLAALPVLRHDLVATRHLLTDRQLNTALVIGRTTPGPKGLYIISVGYYAGGTPGAIAAWIAIITPAILIIPLLEFAGRRASQPRVKQVLRTVVLASAGVSLSATLPLAADALQGAVSYLIAAASLAILLATEVETLWVIAGAAALNVVVVTVVR